MDSKLSWRHLCSASALALLAAGCLTTKQAAACEATANVVDGEVSSVNVDCFFHPSSFSPFATSFVANGEDDYNGDGDDVITVNGGFIASDGLSTEVFFAGSSFELDPSPGAIVTLGGADRFEFMDGQIGDPESADRIDIDLGEGDDEFTAGGLVESESGSFVPDAFLYGAVMGGEGDDEISVNVGGTVVFGIDAGGGNDVVELLGGVIGTGATPANVDLGAGNDSFTAGGFVGIAIGEGGPELIVAEGVLFGAVLGGEGDDTFSINAGATIGTDIFGGAGSDTINVSGGTIRGSVFAGSGNDVVNISNAANILALSADPDAIGLEDGNDQFTMTGGSVGAAVSGGAGNDVLTISGGTIATFLAGNEGQDTIAISGTASIGAHVTAGDGDDIVTISGGTVGTFVDGGDGNDLLVVDGGAVGEYLFGGLGDDTIVLSGGTVGTDIFGDDGNDTINLSGGTIGGSILGGNGVDMVAVSGGSVAGDIDAETVRLFGGTIGGNITGLTGDTLVINDSLSGTPLNLRDGVLFSGTNAVGTITNTDLAQFGSGTFQTQNFSGFSNLTLTNSTLGFTGPQVIDLLNLLGGSTLYVSGNIPLLSQGGGFGNLVVDNSTISLINGDPTDIFQVGDLTLNGAVLGIDLNQVTAQADQIIAGGTFNVLGTNVILVNLVGVPDFFGLTEIPIVLAANAVPTEAFTIEGIPDTAAALFNYQLVPGPDGGLILIATPAEGVLPAIGSPQAAVNSQAAITGLEAVEGITGLAAEFGLGLAGGGTQVQISPTFGVFASGQFARVSHDGFTVSNGGLTGLGPSFHSDDFSAAISLDFNAAKQFGLDERYGLNVGLFGGYTSTDVSMGAFQSLASIGGARNESGMVGTYGLFRQGFNYALVSATTFFGETEVVSDLLNSTGSYDTLGFAATASVGRIFVLSDQLRFDLRGGVIGVTFQGDPFIDSQGNAFGKSRISFGAVKFDPGIYGDFKLDNGMVISPYARLELQQRFGYTNTGSIEGIRFDFDDSDFSGSLSTGFNLKVTPTATVSAEVRGKVSSDSSTLAGKIGLKVGF